MNTCLWSWSGEVPADEKPFAPVNVVVVRRRTTDQRMWFHVHERGQMFKVVREEIVGISWMTAMPARRVLGTTGWTCQCGRPLRCLHTDAVMKAIAARNT